MQPVQEVDEPRKKAPAGASKPLRILHVTSGLGPGGAETVLFRLISNSKDSTHEVICLGPRDWYSEPLERIGVPVHHIEFYSSSTAARGLLPLYQLIRSSKADVVQCWMTRGNAVGGLFGRIAGKLVAWNVRCSTLGPLRRESQMLARTTGRAARWLADYVINCSAQSAELHKAMGYAAVDGGVIPNGYDPAVFFPDDQARAAVRQSLGYNAREFVIGTIGRWHAQKGYPYLLNAIRLLHERGISARLLMVGRELDSENAELQELVQQSGCAGLVAFLGERQDIPALARAPDLHVLASIGVEGFPNAVAEAMLSGTPNVVTDIGDSELIVGDTGWVVAPGDAERLADAIEEAHHEWLKSPDRWQERRQAARQRIAENFSLERMVQSYEQLWRRLAGWVDLPFDNVESPIWHRNGAFNRMARTPNAGAAGPVGGNLDAKTVAGFGREWGHFDQSRLVGAEYDDLFDAYFAIFPFDRLPADAEGFDLGCGSGRWAAGVARRVGRLHCIDAAEKALDVARKRLASFSNVVFHLASADAIPLADGSQDFGYSLGVVHHIPDAARAIADAVRKLKPGAPFLVYIYYNLENRPAWFRYMWRGTDLVRRVTCRLPFPLLRVVTSFIAGTVYWPIARLALGAEKAGLDPTNIPLSGYRHRSFYTMRTDALDRFGTRLEQRFSRDQIRQMMIDAGLADIRFSDRMPFWVACGTKRG